ncbi:MAG: nucleotidyltransferase domain-containing protein, partial [Lachnospiraceae bacterium]|nr:nucleotidyltransferase domain-containing protein [Lachnospiraceae bacterium]
MPSIDSIRENLIPIFGRYNVKKAVLFGSYAKGMADDKSDVDIFVDSGLKGLKF